LTISYTGDATIAGALGGTAQFSWFSTSLVVDTFFPLGKPIDIGPLSAVPGKNSFVISFRSLRRSDIMSAEFQLRWKGGPFDAFAFLTTPNQVVPGPPTLPLQFFNPPGPRYTHPVRLVTGTDLCLWRCGAGRYLGGHAPRRNAVTRRSPALRHRPRLVGLARLEKEEKISNSTRCLIGTPDDIPQRPPRGSLSVLCMP
jgi:hypothetical protein